jgi:hypothetical protein
VSVPGCFHSFMWKNILTSWRFRWAVCQLDTLRACKKVSAVRKALAQLPKTLDETYARILGYPRE